MKFQNFNIINCACTVLTYLILLLAAIRLVNGKTAQEGIVEVLYNNTWGTVCDDDFDEEEIKVICRMLGYETGYIISNSLLQVESSLPIWLDNLDCNGNEYTIFDCEHGGWGIHNCDHDDDVVLRCEGTYVYRYIVTLFVNDQCLCSISTNLILISAQQILSLHIIRDHPLYSMHYKLSP